MESSGTQHLARNTLLLEFVSNGITDNKSISDRVQFIDFSIESILSSPNTFLLGKGIGSFGLLYYGLDGRAYPHNIILEIMFELGFIGLVFVFIIIFIVNKMKNQKSMEKYISVYVLLFLFLNIMKSSSYIDIRVLLVIWGIYIIQDRQFHNKERFHLVK
jgi:O-antigen ligase